MSLVVRSISNPDEKQAITLAVMHALPKWFSPPEDIDNKAVIHRDYPFFALFDGERAVGFAALKLHNEYTADIYIIGILEEYQGCGGGRALVEAAEAFCRETGRLFLTVKTLDSSAEYEPYESTRRFYARMGFIPLEVFTTFWDEKNPCLFLAKVIEVDEQSL